MSPPGPDFWVGNCMDCKRHDRLFQFLPGHRICLNCYRDLVKEATKPKKKEGDDAAS